MVEMLRDFFQIRPNFTPSSKVGEVQSCFYTLVLQRSVVYECGVDLVRAAFMLSSRITVNEEANVRSPLPEEYHHPTISKVWYGPENLRGKPQWKC